MHVFTAAEIRDVGKTDPPGQTIMIFLDIVPELKSRAPALRGRLMANQSLAELTWFRVGGPAQVLFMPEDEGDLAYFLTQLPADVRAFPQTWRETRPHHKPDRPRRNRPAGG